MKNLKILYLLVFVLFIIVFGVSGYSIIEGWTILESLYMTIITVTTIGFKEVHELSDSGRVFTVMYSLIGFLTLAGTVSIISSSIVEGKLLGVYRRIRMEKAIGKLSGHIIICGTGDVGKHVVREIQDSKKPFVVIDKEERAIVELMEDLGLDREALYFVEGDATKEETLVKAGACKAAGVVTCLPEDSQNLFIALTVKNLNPNVRLVSYVADEVNIQKFFLVGVNEVVSGDFIIGRKLAHAILNHKILSFLEQVSVIKGNEAFYLNDVEIKSDSGLVGKSLKDASIPKHCGLLVIAIKKKQDEQFVFNPTSDTILQQGDILISLGQDKHVEKMQQYVNGGLAVERN